MIAMLLALCLSTASGAEIDKAPSGTVVTVRPEAGEHVAVLKDNVSCPEVDLGEIPVPMWLVHPAAWRKAVALGEKAAALEALPDEQSQVIAQLEADLGAERALRSEVRLQLEAQDTNVIALKKSRTHWLIAGLVTGAVAGASGVAVIAF